ncbi:MAG: stage II sporulation protein M [Lachnospiraceae bacterium]|nr:stage II sporulation protein M [Lachnospiraceae bacterium]MDE7239356.1 stage II sporulation protein M [Lachnospiraceae bacterium]
MREHERGRLALLSGSAPFLIGFFAGIALLVLGRSWFLGSGDMMGADKTHYIGYLEIHKNRLLFYVLGLRMRTVAFVLLLSVTPLGRLVRHGYTAWYGLAFGMTLTAAYAVYGVKGLWLVCICLFPQILFYIPAFILLCRTSERIYEQAGGGYRGIGTRQILTGIGVIVLLGVLGCLAEGYINSLIVMKMLKKF